MPSQPESTFPQSQRAPVSMIYFNGFSISVGSSDVSIVGNVDNTAVVEIKTSFTVAKTLSEKLAVLVSQFEKATNHTIMTTDEVNKGIKTMTATPNS